MVEEEELGGHITCNEILRPRLKLLLNDLVVSELLVLVRPNAVPGQLPFHQVDHDVRETLKIISATLLPEQVRVETGKAHSTNEVCLFVFGNVASGPWVNKEASESEVKQVDHLRRVTVYFISLLCRKAFL